MNVTLLSYGSRGDVQPFVALGYALQQIGYQVRLIAPPNFADLADDYAVPFAPVGVDLQAHLAERVKALRAAGRKLEGLRSLRNELNSIIDDVARDTWQAAQGSELIIGVGPSSYSLAEKLGVPFIEAAFQPVTPTRAFPSPVAPTWLKLGGGANWLSHWGFEQMFWQIFRGNTNRMRTQVLDLPRYSWFGPMQHIRKHGLLRMYAFSKYVVPQPNDWPAHHQVTGYWFLPAPANWQPSEELRAFLATGPAPVYIGFGSMIGNDPQKTSALVTEALARTGQRGILAGGWGALDATAQQTEQVFLVNNVPHSWLFPQMSAIVHHGGAGTTGAALRSGVPSIVVPFGFDQPFWGQRVAQLGVGPKPIARKQLTADKLVAAINRAVNDSAMREQAAQLGQLIQAEHGTAQAIDQIHRVLHATSVV